MNDGNGRRGRGGARRCLWRCVAQEYATKFLPLGGHEHMFWVFESAQKILPLWPIIFTFSELFFVLEQQVYLYRQPFCYLSDLIDDRIEKIHLISWVIESRLVWQIPFTHFACFCRFDITSVFCSYGWKTSLALSCLFHASIKSHDQNSTNSYLISPMLMGSL